MTSKKKSFRALLIICGILITLVGGLYFAAQWYREEANQAACTINLSSFEKGIHSYMWISSTSPSSWEELVGENNMYQTMPTCPSGGVYKLELEAIKAHEGQLVTCSHEGHTLP